MSGALKMWRAMYVKELRQNIGWALAAAAVLGLVMRYVVASNADYYSVNFNQLWRQLDLSLMFGSLVLSLGVAFLQILPETSRDRWAFLIHRPAAASTLFNAKVLSGLTLYLLAMLIPFLSTVMWIRKPGNFAAPFDWDLAQSGFAWIASGIPCYLAGFLTAVRPVRWYGTRLFPVLAVLPVMLTLGNAHTLLGSLAWALLMVAFLWPAARAAFLERAGERRPIFGARFALGTTLTLGAAVTLIIVFALSMGVYHSVVPVKSTWVATSQYAVMNDGRLITFSTEQDGVMTIRSIADGSLLYRGKAGDYWLTHSGWTTIEAQLVPIERYDQSISSPERYVSEIGKEESGRPTAWYGYSGMILAYGVQSHLLVEAVGELGYRKCHTLTEARTIRPFPKGTEFFNTGSGSAGKNFVKDGDTIYEIDGSPYEWTHGSISARIALKNPRIASGQLISTDNYRAPIIMLYANTFEVYAGEGNGYRLKFSGNIESPDTNSSTLYGATDHYFVLRYPEPKKDVYVEYDDRGSVVRRYTTPDNVAPQESSTSFTVGMMWPSVMAVTWNLASNLVRPVYGWREAVRALSTSMLAGNVVAAVLSMLVVFATSRRCAFTRSRTICWLIAAAFLGFWAVVSLLCLDGWPARERCRSCGKLRVVTRETCEHCATAWPDRVLDGSEIFEIDEPAQNVRVSA